MLTEQYRPRTWAEVVGQDKLVARIQTLAKRGLAGRAYLLSGQSGTGKTTIARLLAAEVADDFMVQEVDAGTLTESALTDLERESNLSGWCGKPGRAYRESSGCPQESPKKGQVPPRNAEPTPLPCLMSSVGRRDRAGGKERTMPCIAG
jgi:MoxR-like ATPase